ncbi:MAG: GTPase [Candidatus Diapherotrites archaeon]|nr:GTPase [Candidatus Diapherotrites archaeon]
MRRNVIIMGAAGRDFHNFNIAFRNNPNYNVVCFTATQIPEITNRKYPAELAGRLYKKGLPIYPEAELPKLIKKFNAHEVVFAYSDVSHEEVMHKASIVLACGAGFSLLGPKETMLESTKKVIAVCAVRTGSGKSQTTRRILDILKTHRKKAVVIRHPMPYGNLLLQGCQRFERIDDLKRQKCTIEEMEEYEPLIERGAIVYAGVDYEKILRAAEKEAEVIIWDGGNNDFPFIKPDLLIVVTDPHRAGHELLYHPGETNFRMADVIVINKMNTAKKKAIKEIIENARLVNPNARIVKANSELISPLAWKMHNKKVLVVEDGPTLTHGNMAYGAGIIVAKKHKAIIIAPHKYAVGSLRKELKKWKHLRNVLPALGYGKKQVAELESTINRTPCDYVVDATPVNLARILKLNKPAIEVSYELEELGKPNLEGLLRKNKFI